MKFKESKNQFFSWDKNILFYFFDNVEIVCVCVCVCIYNYIIFYR